MYCFGKNVMFSLDNKPVVIPTSKFVTCRSLDKLQKLERLKI